MKGTAELALPRPVITEGDGGDGPHFAVDPQADASADPSKDDPDRWSLTESVATNWCANVPQPVGPSLGHDIVHEAVGEVAEERSSDTSVFVVLGQLFPHEALRLRGLRPPGARW